MTNNNFLPIGVSMQEMDMQDRNERRDSIDQRWHEFLSKCRLQPVFLPNHIDSVDYIDKYQLRGILLTGGGDISAISGIKTRRDLLEHALIKRACYDHIPLLGVCRGMQAIQAYFGMQFQKIQGHVRTRHKILYDNKTSIDVNSYHNYAALGQCDILNINAINDDGVAEAMEHKEKPIKGILWHPERETPFSNHDINIFHEHFYQK